MRPLPLLLTLLLTLPLLAPRAGAATKPPNFVFLVADDMSPEMGCYGDMLAHTPNLDRLAAEGARYTRAFTHCPVCAPSRSGLITGRYPTSFGSHHMRSKVLKPPPMFTSYLQNAGYKILWPGKTDFNFDVPPGSFDSTADWTRGNLPDGPFLAYVNLFMTHESQVRGDTQLHAKNTARLAPSDRQDPAKLPLPSFYPDTPEIRHDIKQYYELVTALDYRAGDILKMLDRKGVADNTVVIFFGDHGRGVPRYKRWVYDSGTRVPFIVRWPGHVQPATVNDDLVAFVDIAPTLLSLAGLPIPKDFQGVPFLGPQARKRQYVYAHRDRMDETFDHIRAVRDRHFQYVRNYNPELPYAQVIQYNELNPIMRSWREMYKAGKLNAVQRAFFAPTKPKEELYDCDTDPDEVHNLASTDDPDLRSKLGELRGALDRWIDETDDLGRFTEMELIRRGIVADSLSQYENRKPQP